MSLFDQQPKRRRKPPHRICSECGIVFRPARGCGYLVFCSDECTTLDTVKRQLGMGYGYIVGIDWGAGLDNGYMMVHASNRILSIEPVDCKGECISFTVTKNRAPASGRNHSNDADAIDENPDAG